jgi:hypothetical protein
MQLAALVNWSAKCSRGNAMRFGSLLHWRKIGQNEAEKLSEIKSSVKSIGDPAFSPKAA